MRTRAIATPQMLYAPVVLGRSVLVLDTFTDTDGVHIHDHIPNIRPGANTYTEILIAGAIPATISGNKALIATDGASKLNYLWIDSGKADVIIKAWLRTIDTDAYRGSEILVRYQDDNNYWLIRAMPNSGTTGTLKIIETVAATPTERASQSGQILKNTNYFITVTAKGETITATLNGITVTWASAVNFKTVTKHGFSLFSEAAPHNEADDFEISKS